MSLGTSIALRMVNNNLVLLTAAAARPTGAHSGDHYKQVIKICLQLDARICGTKRTLTIRMKMGQPPTHSTKILNYVTVFQHMIFKDSVVQCVQFVSDLDIQLCDQLEEVQLEEVQTGKVVTPITIQ